MSGGEIFVTGGAGYVGSHCILELLNAGYSVVAVDNFANAIPGKNGDKPEALKRVEKLTGKTLTFYEADLMNRESFEHIFDKHSFICVIHFAALKAVGESVNIPLDYYRNNVGGTVNLLEVMKIRSVRRIIFSSSATVYGVPVYLPINENHPTGIAITNPYGRTKYFIEEILKDLCESEKGWHITLLRYFNPVGAHPSGDIGENPQGTPNNLMPFISQVAVGRRDKLNIFGSDFNSKDGTGVRDYIHVMDLASGHLAALNQIMNSQESGCKAYNLGTGKGYSVLEVVEAFQKATGVNVPYQMVGRRTGDVDQMYADASLAAKDLKWMATRSLDEMCTDTWRWQSQNPMGFQK